MPVRTATRCVNPEAKWRDSDELVDPAPGRLSGRHANREGREEASGREGKRSDDWAGLVIVRQEHGGQRTVGLGDDPEAIAFKPIS